MPEPAKAQQRRYGYMAIAIRDRGSTPKKMKKAFNAASKVAWHETAFYFHEFLRESRFTPEHAARAKYGKRKRSYDNRKRRSSILGGGKGKADPLTFSGKAKKAAKRAAISSTSKGGKASYAGLRVFNYRHPRSTIRMNQEFRRIIPEEIKELANEYDANLDDKLKALDKGQQ